LQFFFYQVTTVEERQRQPCNHQGIQHVPFAHIVAALHDGSVTDAKPIKLEWDILGDKPAALKDGVACWMAPTPAFPEGEVLIAGGLWSVGIAHMHEQVYLNKAFAYDVARRLWTPLPLPPFTPGRTQGACIQSSLIIISGGDGGTVGSRVMRLSKATPISEWAWDTLRSWSMLGQLVFESDTRSNDKNRINRMPFG
jgi:hypothetical protein